MVFLVKQGLRGKIAHFTGNRTQAKNTAVNIIDFGNFVWRTRTDIRCVHAVAKRIFGEKNTPTFFLIATQWRCWRLFRYLRGKKAHKTKKAMKKIQNGPKCEENTVKRHFYEMKICQQLHFNRKSLKWLNKSWKQKECKCLLEFISFGNGYRLLTSRCTAQMMMILVVMPTLISTLFIHDEISLY